VGLSVPKKISSKDSLAHQRIDDHEKLCQIMQRETNRKINELHTDIHRIEKIMISSSAFLITSMLGLIVALLLKVF
jgi:lipopolysaccharide/colanic/teichoic acid biosynthesis glycosyltransferase